MNKIKDFLAKKNTLKQGITVEQVEKISWMDVDHDLSEVCKILKGKNSNPEGWKLNDAETQFIKNPHGPGLELRIVIERTVSSGPYSQTDG